MCFLKFVTRECCSAKSLSRSAREVGQVSDMMPHVLDKQARKSPLSLVVINSKSNSLIQVGKAGFPSLMHSRSWLFLEYCLAFV